MAPASRQLRGQAVTAATSVASVLGVLGVAYWLDIPSLFGERLKTRKVEPRCFPIHDEPSLTAFKTLVEQATLKQTYPLARAIENNIPIYDCRNFDLDDERTMNQLQDELYHCLTAGPGVYVLKSFFTDLSSIDTANSAFVAIIQQESEAGPDAKGDHFAPKGHNSRIWNSFGKHCLQDPASFLAYYSNPWFRVASEAYLGPAYRLTTQCNIVHPGGAPQTCHRDFHLGFQTAEDVARWPKATHAASALLTLQGAVAHSDMPLQSGPTRFLPYSQLFPEGYLAYRRKEFDEYFLQNWVSLPLEKGDAVFFSPALFHAAGQNHTTDVHRSANLIQVSSAFGKTMESIDSIVLVDQVYELLLSKRQIDGWTREVDAFVKAVAEGYPFPTNLDRRPPAPGGMAPESEQDVLEEALREGWTTEIVVSALKQMRHDSQA